MKFQLLPVWPKKMFEARRQHPVAAITKVMDIIRENFITILIIIFVGSGTDEESLINLTWILGTILVLLIWGVLSWLRFTYRVEDGELHIRQGIMIRQNVYLSRDRIQVIDISAGVVQRIFGLVSVQVKTAGQNVSQTKISAVTRDEAEQLRNVLRREAGFDTPAAGEEAVPSPVYTLNAKDLVIAASTSGSFGIALSVVGTVFAQIDQVLSEEQIIRFLEQNLPSSAGSSMVVSTVVLVIVISWLLSFLGTLIKYSGFEVVAGKDELIISRGLFERRQITIPFNRIQAIQIKEELLRQPFGYISVVLESAGYQEEGGRSTVLFPLLKSDGADGFLENTIPEYNVSCMSVGPPQVSIRRFVIRVMLTALTVIIPVWILIPYGAVAFFLLLPAAFLGYAQYRAAAIGTTPDGALLLRYRTLSKVTAVIRRYRVQSVEIRQTPFQKRLDLSNLSYTVASGHQGRTFTVRELPAAVSAHFWEWISARGTSEESLLEIPEKTVLPDLS